MTKISTVHDNLIIFKCDRRKRSILSSNINLFLIIAVLSCPVLFVTCKQETFTLNRTLFEIHYNAVHMSYLSYRSYYDPNNRYMNGFQFDTNINFTNIDPWYGNATNYVKFYDDSPERAVLAKINGRCYISFRGSVGANGDTRTNFEPGKVNVCPDANNPEECCTVRKGFHDAYYDIPFRVEMEADIQYCYEQTQCYIQKQQSPSPPSPPTDCVIYTGHSQGAAISASGALYHYNDWNPLVINFAWPNSIFPDCSDMTNIVDFTRWFAYQNSRTALLGITRLYDLVPNLPYLDTEKYGHIFLLSEDPSGVAYIGYNTQRRFGRSDIRLQTHNMVNSRGNSYIQRMKDMMVYVQQRQVLERNDNNVTIDGSSYIVRTTGFLNGSPCTYDEECDSGNCERRFFLSPRYRNICKP